MKEQAIQTKTQTEKINNMFPDLTGPVRTGPGWTQPDQSGPDRSGPGRTGPDQSGIHYIRLIYRVDHNLQV